jgi:DNA topoisomerase I
MPSVVGLHHSNDNLPGITRKRDGDDFLFFDEHGKRIRNKKVVERLMKLGIPPAYHAVWIFPDPKGHLQATARDDRGRKQYIYHPAWNAHRDATKYDRLLPFAEALGSIRRRIAKDIRLRGMPKEKVLATLVKLLDTTYIRIGNEEYARENKSYGLTTFLNRHLKGRGEGMRFVFRGKSGVPHEIPIEDKRVRKIVAQCQDLRGQALFEYLDDEGNIHSVHSEDVNQYLQRITDTELTAKDFRTWHGTVLAMKHLVNCKPNTIATELRKNVTTAIKEAAIALGNTASVCKKCYIHPKVIALYLKHELAPKKPGRFLKHRYPELYLDELEFVELLEKW